MNARALLGIAVLATATYAASAAAADLRPLIAAEIDAGPAARLGLRAHGFDAARIDDWLASLYAERGLAPIWFSGETLGPRAADVLASIDEAESHGIPARAYDRELLDELRGRSDSASQAQLEILLTLTLGRLASNARQGQIIPYEVEPELFEGAPLEHADFGALAREALVAADLRAFVRSQYPQHVHYRRLLLALARYRGIAARGGWPIVLPGPTLKPGQSDPRIAQVRQRLGLDSQLAGDDSIYDAGLEAAVRKFQADNGLDADGAVGRRTIETMNILVEDRLRTLLVNLERWRWLPRDLGSRFVLVNIAGFELFALDRSEIVLRMPVIVGTALTSTPVFSDRIRYIELNPYWNVPTSILADEMLPKLQLDPNYLAGEHMRLLAGWGEDAAEIDPRSVDWDVLLPEQMNRFRVRQDPGPWNSLGTIKFMFPNRHHIYLHDTPTPGLFARNARAFSHGCIRVSHPLRLAEFLLGGAAAGWTADDVKAAIETRQRQTIRLPEPVPVHLTYRTAWVEADDSVQFRTDIYGRDAIVAAALFAARPTPRL